MCVCVCYGVCVKCVRMWCVCLCVLRCMCEVCEDVVCVFVCEGVVCGSMY